MEQRCPPEAAQNLPELDFDPCHRTISHLICLVQRPRNRYGVRIASKVNTSARLLKFEECSE